MLMNKLSGVIFDLDNTLVSSFLNFNKIKALLDCPYEINILDHVDVLPRAEKLSAKKMLVRYEMKDAKQSEKLIGTEDLLNWLVQLNIPHAIVTRNCRQAALLKMANNHIHIPLLLTREDHKAKPAPDALLYIADQWQLSPEKILLVGDHLYDLQAAKNANMPSCLVTNGMLVDYEHPADIVVGDLIELKQNIAFSFD